jgi:hypothetical protein
MINYNLKNKIINLIDSLQQENGGYSNQINQEADPQATLSCLKIYELFELSPPKPDNTFEYLTKLYNSENNAFKNPITNQDNVFTTAACLLGIKILGAKDFFDKVASRCLDFMSQNASIREEHFMTIGLIDECKLDYIPQKSIDFFNNQLNNNDIFGDSVLNNAISASALIRAGIKPQKISEIITLVLKSQTKEGGFSEDGINSNLWVSYCVMRLLDLEKVTTYNIELKNWVLANIDFLLAKNGETFSANLLYQNLSVLQWIINPRFKSVEENNSESLQNYIQKGFSKSLINLKSWSLLQTAAVRSNVEIIKYLLNNNDDIEADINFRLESADATALYFAGQSGDIETIKLLLSKNQEQIFDYSKINGHTLLLQLAFFGSENHINSIKHIFNNLNKIFTNKSEKDLNDIRLKLTSATNVRGYNISSMANLWGNALLQEVAEKFDISTTESRTKYLETLSQNIFEYDKTIYSRDSLTDEFISCINDFFNKINSVSYDCNTIEKEKNNTLDKLCKIISNTDFNINKIGGILSETPLISSITGIDIDSKRGMIRYEICKFLLESGADADIEEIHPMRVDAVIRASVLNKFDILKLIAEHTKPLAFKFAMNVKPAVNGQTALQDSVHRAFTSSGDSLTNHLNQIKWMIERGADIDIEDYRGNSPRKLSLEALNDNIFKKNAEVIISTLEIINN